MESQNKMQSVTDELVHLENGIPCFIASPAGSGPFPAIIVVHEIFGLNDHIKDVCRRFAAQSIVALAPDLFARAPGLPEDRDDLAAMRGVWQEIADEELIRSLQLVYYLAGGRDDVAVDKVGAIGYCMGGAIAFMFACKTQGLSWVADYYGRIRYPQLSHTKPKHPIDYLDELRCPVLGLFASGDELIPEEQIEEFKERLKSKNKRSQIKIYENASHAFFNDTREFYNKEAASDAWKRTLDFIKEATSVSAER